MSAPKPRRRRVAPYVVAGAAVLLAAAGLKATVFHAKPPPRFVTATAARGDIEQTVLATGTVQPFELVNVGAQVSGRVVSLTVGLGDHVTKGQVIATIDPVPQQMALANAQAVLAQMQAQRLSQQASLQQDQIALKREATTLAADASSQADYDTAQATYKAAEANLAAIEAQIAQAKVSVRIANVNLGYTNIVAPIDGEVVAVVTKQGQTVNSVQAAPTIVMLGRMDQMTVKAQISEADVIKVRPGARVYFTILGDPARRYYATLRSVAPAPELVVNDTNTESTAAGASSASTTQAIYYDGLFDVANPDRRLRADMTAEVHVITGEANGVVTVPAAALTDGPPPHPAVQDGRPTLASPSRGGPSHGGPTRDGLARDGLAGSGLAGPGRPAMVQVLDPSGKATPRAVRVGLSDSVNTEVLSGLAPGERVVLGQAAGGPAPGFRGGPPPPGGF